MNLFRRFLALFRRPKATDPVQVALSRARTAEMREARSLIVSTERAERRYERENSLALAAEWIEAQQMGPGGLMNQSLTVTEAGTKAMAVKERFWELELSLDSLGWQRERMASLMEFSRYGIQQIILMARYFFIKNPLIKRGVKICASYITGRGFTIASPDERANQTIQDFLEANAKEFGQSGMVQKVETLYTDGNLFFVFFDEPSAGNIRVGTIDATEISEIISNPDDSSEPWYFLRSWSSVDVDLKTGVAVTNARRAWYPALDRKDLSATVIRGLPVRKERVLQAKYGGLPKWQFGCPDVYAAIDPARQYKSFLDNWAAVNQALARFAWDAKTKGGLGAIQNFSRVLSTTLGNAGGTMIEENPPPVMGSAFVSGPGTTLTPVKTGDKQGDPEQGRRILLMVCAALGLPETFFGDTSTGSLATAKSLDRPTELKFLKMQQFLREILTVIIRYVLDRSATAPAGKMREASATSAGKPAINITFPEILEHDITEMANAMVSICTLNGYKSAGTVEWKSFCIAGMTALGIENAGECFEAMYPDYDPQFGDGTGQPPPEPEAPPEGKQQNMNQEASLARAVASLRKASEALVVRNGQR